MIVTLYRRLRSLGGRIYRGRIFSKFRPPSQAISLITGGVELSSHRLISRINALEGHIAANPKFDKIGAHRDIGKALFARSPELYNGNGLPEYLKRYTYPALLSIALNSHCNASCFFCRDADYKGTVVSHSDIDKLKNAISNARSIDLTGWGEPLLYPMLEDVIGKILILNNSKNIITLTTNGSLLSEKWGRVFRGKIYRLVISINAATEKTHANQMRFKSKKFTLLDIVNNIKEFQSQLTDDDRGRIVLHMVANTENYHEMDELVRLAASLGIKKVNIGNFICADENLADKTLWNIKEKYNQGLKAAFARGMSSGISVSGRKFFVHEEAIAGAANCMAPFENCFVEMPGTVAPCCYMADFRMGNVYEEGFEAVWFGDLFTKLRRSRYLPACQVCTVFTPFDDKKAHISGYITSKDVAELAVADS